MKNCFQMRMHLSSLYIRDARTVHWLNNGTRVAWSHTLAGMHRRGEEELIKIPRQTPPRSIEQPNARTKIRLKIDGRRLSQWSCPVSMKPLGRSVANVWGCGCKNVKKAGLLRRGWRGVVVEYHVCVCVVLEDAVQRRSTAHLLSTAHRGVDCIAHRARHVQPAQQKRSLSPALDGLSIAAGLRGCWVKVLHKYPS